MFKNLINVDSYMTWAMIGTLIFFVMFLGILVRTVLLKKGFTQKMSALPLDHEAHDATQYGD